MLVGFGLCMLRIFEGYINWLHYSCFVLWSRLFQVVCPLICVCQQCAEAVVIGLILLYCFVEQVFLFE